MTSSRLVAWLLLTVLAVVVFFAVAANTRGENYGAVTPRQREFVQHAIHAWFDPHNLGSLMECIANRESGFAPTAYNDDDASVGESVAGVFQIKWPLWSPANPVVWTDRHRFGWILKFWRWRSPTWPQFRARLADPVQSIRFAYMMVRHLGLDPWGGRC